MCDGPLPNNRSNSSACALYESANSLRSDGLYKICAYLFRFRNRTIRLWQPVRRSGHLLSVNGSEKLRCNPACNRFVVASPAARSESAMKTIALTDVILPAVSHLSAASVSATEQP